jgi:hypothetical protein
MNTENHYIGGSPDDFGIKQQIQNIVDNSNYMISLGHIDSKQLKYYVDTTLNLLAMVKSLDQRRLN